MAVTLTGVASVYGIDGTLAYTGVAAPSGRFSKRMSVKRTADRADLKNSYGEKVGGASTNRRRNITIVFTPVATGGGTIIQARAALKEPDDGARITLSNMPNPDHNGDYSCGDVDTEYNNEGYAEMTISATRYLDNDVTAPVS